MLQRSKDIHSDIEIKFQAEDWGLLFSMLRMRTQEHARTIDTFQANSIMLANISLGLFLLGVLQLYSLLMNFHIAGIVLAIVFFLFSIIARQRSRRFHQWFLTDKFESSLRFGNRLQDVIDYDRREPQEIKQIRKRKNQTSVR